MTDEMWAIAFVLNGATEHLLVRDGSGDNVLSPVLTTDGRLVISQSRPRLSDWVLNNDTRAALDLEEMRAAVDFDAVRRDLARRTPHIDADVILEAWNLLDDVLPAVQMPFNFRGPTSDRAYDKLFWSLNLESVTPVGERYVPAWSADEIRKIRTAIRKGVERLIRSVADGFRP